MGIDKDGKKLDKVSLQVFILVLVFIPFWASTILPLSIIYQIGMAICNTFFVKKKSKNGKGESSTSTSTSNDTIDSGYEVNESDIIPRKDRKYDMIFLGASGFTGQIAVSYLAKN